MAGGRKGGEKGFHPSERALALAEDIIAKAQDLVGLLLKEEELGTRPPHVPLPLEIPLRITACLHQRDQDPKALVEEVRRQIREALFSFGTFRIGRVYCFQCDSLDCTHSRPPDPADVFTGFTLGGRPTWTSLVNLLLSAHDERVDLLYSDPHGFVAILQTSSAFEPDGLAAYASRRFSYRVIGQVIAGLLPEGFLKGSDARSSITVQAVETGPPSRLRLNILGPSLEDLSEAMASSGPKGLQVGLRKALDACARRLEVIGRRAHRRKAIEGKVLSVLNRLRGDLERLFRSASRRTRHAEERHMLGERPTGAAIRDALRAKKDSILLDVETDTFVVLGPRRRAHIFSRDGRLVTSLLIKPAEVKRRVERAKWKTATKEEAESLKRLLEKDEEPSARTS